MVFYNKFYSNEIDLNKMSYLNAKSIRQFAQEIAIAK